MIVAGPVWGAVCGKKFYVPVPDQIANQKDIDESKLPSFCIGRYHHHDPSGTYHIEICCRRGSGIGRSGTVI